MVRSDIDRFIGVDVPTDEYSDVDYSDYGLSLHYPWFGFEGIYTEFVSFEVEEWLFGYDDIGRPSEERLPDMETRLLLRGRLYISSSWRFDYESIFDPAKDKETGFGLGALLSYNSVEIETKRGPIR